MKSTTALKILTSGVIKNKQYKEFVAAFLGKCWIQPPG
jgi:hypothetical protein